MEAKIIQIGNSKGVRLPKRLLAKYGLTESVVLREVENGILIEPPGGSRLSWEDTYKAMSGTDEDWSDWTELDVEDLNEDR
jgi:antitoxin MazE